MSNKSFLPTNPQLFKKISDTTCKSSKLPELNLQEMAGLLIDQQKNRIKELEIQISAMEVQIDAEKKNKEDHGPYINLVEREVADIRNEQTYINEQINNCQMVENQVTPVEYYLWKKTQRINTYDASIAELCKNIETERAQLERSIEDYRRDGEQLSAEIERLEERVSQLNSSAMDLFTPVRPFSQESQPFEQLLTANVALREEYSTLTNTNEILQQNKDIVAMQISDNIRSIESTLKNYFQGEKIKLVKEFKQILMESKSTESSPVTPLNPEEQSYKIDPLLTDYNYKLKELYTSAPEEIKKVVMGILQPLAWQKFYWRDFLEVDPKSQQIYSEYKKLQTQFMEMQTQKTALQHQVKEVAQEITAEQKKATELAENIRKMKKRLKK